MRWAPKIEMMLRFSDAPPGTPPMGKVPPEKIMHATLRVGEAIVYAADGGCHAPANFQGFSLSLTLPDVATAERCFAALSSGGAVRMPLGQTFFAKAFGMLTDRFGVGWMIRTE